MAKKATTSSTSKGSSSKKLAAPAPKPAAKTPASKAPVKGKAQNTTKKSGTKPVAPLVASPTKVSNAYLLQQKKKLEDLRDILLDQMQDVSQGSLRTAPDSGGGAAFGQHMGDAGSDAYEKDFALSLLSQEQDSLYEINEAIKRIEGGTYGVCELSNKDIPKARLEAIPWARFTVECQAEIEKQNKGRRRWDSTPQFMETSEGAEDEDDEEMEDDSRPRNNKD